ncbi:hypothetical protein SAMN02745221_00296 [Thermosyntropha lipolytica DSM 11003]|uniref:Uncharacterized protein n=1 Tax=Thermosyntropha lipolytica DSM 11003 TaxID=1123382 RepID=A0A1M5K581_9FIRM|nr:hypothetical protein [Thermosyntropha lipolytica]SHG48002.1 hypothetical protein SAMN02745221_00296 [Thermosyntropha lipolytica DSM 11003]
MIQKIRNELKWVAICDNYPFSYSDYLQKVHFIKSSDAADPYVYMKCWLAERVHPIFNAEPAEFEIIKKVLPKERAYAVLKVIEICIDWTVFLFLNRENSIIAWETMYRKHFSGINKKGEKEEVLKIGSREWFFVNHVKSSFHEVVDLVYHKNFQGVSSINEIMMDFINFDLELIADYRYIGNLINNILAREYGDDLVIVLNSRKKAIADSRLFDIKKVNRAAVEYVNSYINSLEFDDESEELEFLLNHFDEDYFYTDIEDGEYEVGDYYDEDEEEEFYIEIEFEIEDEEDDVYEIDFEEDGDEDYEFYIEIELDEDDDGDDEILIYEEDNELNDFEIEIDLGDDEEED